MRGIHLPQRRGLNGLMGPSGIVNPTDVDAANLLLWLRADQGVTLSSAVVDDFGSWAATLLTPLGGQSDPDSGTGAYQLTESTDASPQTHLFIDNPSNLQVGVNAFRFWLKAAGRDYWRMQAGASTAISYQASTQAFTGPAGTCSGRVVSTSGDWHYLQVEATGTTSPQIAIMPAVSGIGGGQVYQGDGRVAGYVYSPIEMQDRVSAWADQSGNGNDATQGTAANQMLYQELDGSGLWIPTGGSPRIGWPVDASKTVSLAAAIATALSGDSQPWTIIELRNIVSVPASSPASGLLLLGATAQAQLGNNRSANDYFYFEKDDGALIMTKSYSPLITALHSIAAVFDGSTVVQYLNGVSGAAGDLDVGMQTFSSATLSVQNATRREFILYKSALSDSDRKAVTNGARARWGLASI